MFGLEDKKKKAFVFDLENDLKKNGKFRITMAAKDGSASFDFTGIYTSIQEQRLIEYRIADGRRVKITFASRGHENQITETFEAEDTNPPDMQKKGWQAILNNFKKYTEEINGE